VRVRAGSWWVVGVEVTGRGWAAVVDDVRCAHG
jgi:hypothetical protein